MPSVGTAVGAGTAVAGTAVAAAAPELILTQKGSAPELPMPKVVLSGARSLK